MEGGMMNWLVAVVAFVGAGLPLLSELEVVPA
jgi:hypothetical protein